MIAHREGIQTAVSTVPYLLLLRLPRPTWFGIIPLFAWLFSLKCLRVTDISKHTPSSQLIRWTSWTTENPVYGLRMLEHLTLLLPGVPQFAHKKGTRLAFNVGLYRIELPDDTRYYMGSSLVYSRTSDCACGPHLQLLIQRRSASTFVYDSMESIRRRSRGLPPRAALRMV